MPKKQIGTNTRDQRNFSVWMDGSLKARLKKIADREEASLNWTINEACRQYANRREAAQKRKREA